MSVAEGCVVQGEEKEVRLEGASLCGNRFQEFLAFAQVVQSLLAVVHLEVRAGAVQVFVEEIRDVTCLEGTFRDCSV